ncbi:MAG TPA: sulfur reduction protein DsrE [Intrasporangiaceae bacterium]|nr:sulfur reduction protein DsrE [Intrasporangiaceae bacterium]
MSRRLLVKVTCDLTAAERLNQALTVPATAAASGVEVSVWLSGEPTRLAVPGFAETLPTLPHAVSVAELRDTLLDLARVTVCSQCAKRRDLTEADLLPGARIAGAAGFVEESLVPGTQALVY